MTRSTMVYGVLVSMIWSGHAISAPKLKQSDFANQPAYCRAKMFRTPEQSYWVKAMGRACYSGIHHYCSALAWNVRSITARDRKDREFIYQREAAELDYVLKRWDPECSLFPDALVRKGKLLERVGDRAQSAEYYLQAIEANPRFATAYVALSNWYKKNGDLVKAKSTLQRGLQANPNSQMLKIRLDKLTGTGD